MRRARLSSASADCVHSLVVLDQVVTQALNPVDLFKWAPVGLHFHRKVAQNQIGILNRAVPDET